MKNRKCKCSCANEVTKAELQRIQRILSKLDEDDIEEMSPGECFRDGDFICCRVDGRIICLG